MLILKMLLSEKTINFILCHLEQALKEIQATEDQSALKDQLDLRAQLAPQDLKEIKVILEIALM